MKKIFLILIFLALNSLICSSQTWNWAKVETTGGDPDGFGNCISSDDSGNSYFAVAGLISGVTLLKFDNSGNFVWSGNAGSAYHNRTSQFVSYRSNYEYWAGNFTSKILVFYTDTLFPGTSYSDVFLTKYNTSGVLQWAKQSKSLHFGSAVAYAVAADGLGNSYVTGVISDTVSFDTDTLKSDLGAAFLVKYAPNGNLLWAKSGSAVSTSYWAYPLSVSADNAGNSYIGGYYAGSVIFGKDTLPMAPVATINAFLVKYDQAGNVLWAWAPKITTGWKGNHIQSVSCDIYGNAYVAGTFKKGSIVIGKDTFATVNACNPFLAKFNPSGIVSWAKQVYELDNNAWGVISVAVDSVGKGCVCLKDSGIYAALKIKLGNDTLPFSFGNNGFLPDALFQFDSAGNVNCGAMFAEQNEDDGDGMCISPSGQYIYVAGDIDALSEGIFGTDTITNTFNSAEYSFIASWQPCTNTETSVNSIYVNAGVQVFPNPSSGLFNIVCHSEDIASSQVKVEVYNVMGEKVYSQLTMENGQWKINLTSQPSGVYFYRVIAKSGNILGEGKLVIQK